MGVRSIMLDIAERTTIKIGEREKKKTIILARIYNRNPQNADL